MKNKPNEGPSASLISSETKHRGEGAASPNSDTEKPYEAVIQHPPGVILKGLAETVMERRATTHFSSDPVPLEIIKFILQVAGQAPSGYNLQPWRFIVVRTEGGRNRLRKAAMDQEKITEAPVVIIAVGMKREPIEMAEQILADGAKRGAGEPEEVAKTAAQARKFLSEFPMDVWVNRHTMIAVTYLMLAAEACGYDTAPMEGFDPAAVKQGFGIPEEGEVVALVAIGRMKEPDKAYPGLLPVSRIAFQETFGLFWYDELLGRPDEPRSDHVQGT